MPNHVTHKINISGSKTEIDRFRETCFVQRDGVLELDFNTLIPMPEILEKTISGNTHVMKTDKYQAIESEAIKQSGHANWYSWSCSEWGTKWNAYHTYIKVMSDDTMLLQFDTAWSCPEPIFDKIAELFPTLDCDGVALDEGYGFCADINISMGDSYIDYDFDVSSEFIEDFESR